MYATIILPRNNHLKELKATLIVMRINQLASQKSEKEKLLFAIIKTIDNTQGT